MDLTCISTISETLYTCSLSIPWPSTSTNVIHSEFKFIVLQASSGIINTQNRMSYLTPWSFKWKIYNRCNHFCSLTGSWEWWVADSDIFKWYIVFQQHLHTIRTTYQCQHTSRFDQNTSIRAIQKQFSAFATNMPKPIRFSI